MDQVTFIFLVIASAQIEQYMELVQIRGVTINFWLAYFIGKCSVCGIKDKLKCLWSSIFCLNLQRKLMSIDILSCITCWISNNDNGSGDNNNKNNNGNNTKIKITLITIIIMIIIMIIIVTIICTVRLQHFCNMINAFLQQ